MLYSDNIPNTAVCLRSFRDCLSWLVAGASLVFFACDGSETEQDINSVLGGVGENGGAGVTAIGPTGGSTVASGGTIASGGTVATGGTVPTPTGGMELSGGSGGVIPFDGGSADDGGGDIEGEVDGGLDESGGTGGDDLPPPVDCLEGIDSYASDGPFTYQTAQSGRINMYVPDVPAGCKVPMVHQSNGTGGNCMFYASILRRLATNGFLALCYESTQTGAGTFGIDAFKAALAEYPDVADYRFGSTGHSQGGMAAFNTLAYAEREWGDQGIYAGLPMEPASGFGANPIEGWTRLYASIKSPVFMFSGLGTDTLVSQGWVQSAFMALDDATEAYFYTKAGANHIGTIGRDGSEVVVSWFRWKLLGDTKACEYFKALPQTDATWAVAASQNEQPCN